MLVRMLPTWPARLITALVAAALAPAALTLVLGDILLSRLSFQVSLVAAAVLVAPAALLLRLVPRRLLVLAPLTGFVVIGALGAVWGGRDLGPLPSAALFGGSGSPADSRVLPLGLGLGVLGGAGGLAAALAWRASRRQPIASALVTLCGTASFLLLTEAQSPDCTFADSAPTASARAVLQLKPGEESDLRAIMADFARAMMPPVGVQPATAAMGCHIAPPLFSISQPIRQGESASEVNVTVRGPGVGQNWAEPTRALLLAIEARWPGSLRFFDEGNASVPAPVFLASPVPQP